MLVNDESVALKIARIYQLCQKILMINNVQLYVCFIPNVEPQFTRSTDVPSGVHINRHTRIFQQFIILCESDGGNRDSSSVLLSRWQAHNKTCLIQCMQLVSASLLSMGTWFQVGCDVILLAPSDLLLDHHVIQLTMVYPHKHECLLSQPYKNYCVLPISYW